MERELREILQQIETANPANEAEVETKILLHVFRLLGFTDTDRADKPTISMQFGRERKLKHPDFVLYEGAERSLTNALISVEAKSASSGLNEADYQVQSYAAWAGTPFYVICDGHTIRAVQYLPGAPSPRRVDIPVKKISEHWSRLYEFLSRSEVVLAKDRLSYISSYLPEVEQLPPRAFFREYLTRVNARFSGVSKSVPEALRPPSMGQHVLPQIPVAVQLDGDPGAARLNEAVLALRLSAGNRRVMLTGAPGAGKSTLCKRVTSILASTEWQDEPGVVPLYIPARRGIPRDATDAFRRACQDMGVRVFEHLFRDPLSRALLVVMLDGLDELENPAEALPQLDRFLANLGDQSVLIATRPIGAEAFRSRILATGFERATICDLTDADIHNVLVTYLGGESAADAILHSVPVDLRQSLRSPLFTLLMVRVAQIRMDWATLSRYELMGTYVLTLHEYYNSVTIRGDVADAESVLDVLARVASELALHKSTPRPSLQELAQRMAAERRDGAFRGLVNTGLLLSANGEAVFVHQSFQDFGIALQMVGSVRQGEMRSFGRVLPNASVYSLAASAIGPLEEDQLLQWSIRGNGKARRRALGLLRERSSPRLLNAMLHILREDSSDKRWYLALRIVIDAQDWSFVSHLGELLRNRWRRPHLVVRAIGPDNAERLAPELARAAEAAQKDILTATALLLAVRFGSAAPPERLVNLFRSHNTIERRLISRSLSRKRPTTALIRLLNSLLQAEEDPDVILNLLVAAGRFVKAVSDDAIVAASGELGDIAQPTSQQADACKVILTNLRYVEQLRPALVRLADACARIANSS